MRANKAAFHNRLIFAVINITKSTALLFYSSIHPSIYSASYLLLGHSGSRINEAAHTSISQLCLVDPVGFLCQMTCIISPRAKALKGCFLMSGYKDTWSDSPLWVVSPLGAVISHQLPVASTKLKLCVGQVKLKHVWALLAAAAHCECLKPRYSIETGWTHSLEWNQWCLSHGVSSKRKYITVQLWEYYSFK